MKTKLKLVGLVSVIAALWHRLTNSQDIVLANMLPTRAGCRDSKLSDEAIGRRTLVAFGSDADHVKVCDAADIPLGVTEEASSDNAEQRVAFGQFGLLHEEVEATASGDIEDGDFLVAADGGKVRTLPEDAGTYYIIGRAKGDTDDTKLAVFIPYAPVQRVVAG